MPLKHFQPLEKCRCGAYRYLAAREHRKSFEVVLIHQMPGGERKYLKVASFPKSVLEFHEARNRGRQHGDSLLKSALETRAQLSTLITTLQKRDK
ncbi:MAG: hypothetical protein JRN62_03985 [Nitrososphaerota archaeon]|jgi:hypothetical protein|nr:hypothetical protein [Nitrososphaerota archaeon]MDG6948763.1 hypothetical protein [Nitrososphaerota archaeon]